MQEAAKRREEQLLSRARREERYRLEAEEEARKENVKVMEEEDRIASEWRAEARERYCKDLAREFHVSDYRAIYAKLRLARYIPQVLLSMLRSELDQRMAWRRAERERAMKDLWLAVRSGDADKAILVMRREEARSRELGIVTPSLASEKCILLHRACRSTDHDGAVALLLSIGFNSNCVDKAGNTPLHVAASHGHWEALKALSAHGARPCASFAPASLTPLALACSTGRLAIAQHLVEVVGDAISAVDGAGRSILHHALDSNSPAVARYVLNRIRNDFPRPAQDGTTCLMLAAKHRQDALMEELVISMPIPGQT